jgi:hypothetical protein
LKIDGDMSGREVKEAFLSDVGDLKMKKKATNKRSVTSEYHLRTPKRKKKSNNQVHRPYSLLSFPLISATHFPPLYLPILCPI